MPSITWSAATALGLVLGTGDRLRANQVDEVRAVRIPAVELVLGLVHAGITLAPPLGSAIVHAVANGLGDGDPSGQAFAASLPPQRAREDIAVYIGCSHSFLRAQKKPAAWPAFGRIRSCCAVIDIDFILVID